MSRQLIALLTGLSIGSAVAADDVQSAQSPVKDYSTQVLPVLKKYCFLHLENEYWMQNFQLTGFFLSLQ